MPEPIVLSSDGIHRTAETSHLIHLTRGDLVKLLALHVSFEPTGPEESMSSYFVGNF